MKFTEKKCWKLSRNKKELVKGTFNEGLINSITK